MEQNLWGIKMIFKDSHTFNCILRKVIRAIVKKMIYYHSNMHYTQFFSCDDSLMYIIEDHQNDS